MTPNPKTPPPMQLGIATARTRLKTSEADPKGGRLDPRTNPAPAAIVVPTSLNVNVRMFDQGTAPKDKRNLNIM